MTELNHLLTINGRVNELMDNAAKRTVHEVQALENAVHEYRLFLDAIERRKWQAEQLKRPDTEPVRWLGEIGNFIDDLIFHARALQRQVRGQFNGVLIVASPNSVARDLYESYRADYDMVILKKGARESDDG